MNPVPDIFRILPELILTLTGVAVMFADATLPNASNACLRSPSATVNARLPTNIFIFFFPNLAALSSTVTRRARDREPPSECG